MDNAAIHHAEIVLNAFANPTVEPLFLPVYSPHLNPVELIFATMKRRMAKHGRPRTRAALKEAVTAALQQLSVRGANGSLLPRNEKMDVTGRMLQELCVKLRLKITSSSAVTTRWWEFFICVL